MVTSISDGSAITITRSPTCTGRPRHSSWPEKIATPPCGALSFDLASSSLQEGRLGALLLHARAQHLQLEAAASSLNDLKVARCRSARAMSSGFARQLQAIADRVSSSTRELVGLHHLFGLTTISRTTPSSGEVIGIGLSGVISAGASALSAPG